MRSVSSWAPVCIGPYSQANTLGKGSAIALVAGQIGLQPASMTLPPRLLAVDPIQGSSTNEINNRSSTPTTPSTDGAVTSTATTGSATFNDPMNTRPTGITIGGGPDRITSTSHCGDEDIVREELRLCVSHASSVGSAVGASLSRGCLFATLYVSEATAAIRMAHADGDGDRDGDEKQRQCFWLQSLVDECRALIFERVSKEKEEASAEAAGTGCKGVEEDEDSAEEGWNSDPEELAKEAAKKNVRQ